MAHGIGLHTRELDTGQAAQDALVARAQGSLVPDQTRPAATTPSELGRRAGGQATARPTRGFGSPGIPSLEDDPAGAIFFAMRELGAALQGKKLPSETARDIASANEELELKRQGLRLKGIGLGMRALKSGLELLDKTPLDQQDAVIGQITKSVQIPGFDMAAILRAHKEGTIDGFKARLDQIRADPFMAAFLASIPDIEKASPKVLNDAMARAIKAKEDITAAVEKQKQLAPGKKAAAEEKAAREVKTAADKQAALAPGKTKAAGEEKAAREAAEVPGTREKLAQKLARGEDLTPGEEKAAEFLAQTDPFTRVLNELRAGRVKNIVAKQKLSSSDKELLEQATKALPDKGRKAVEDMLRQLGRENLIPLLP